MSFEQLLPLGFALVLLYLGTIHLAYFIFNAYFKALFNYKVKYSSIWYFGFKTEEIKT